MKKTSLRPRFRLEVEMSPEDAYQMVVQALEGPDCRLGANLLQRQIELKIPEPEHHFWSPQLNLVFRQLEDDKAGALLEGRFGPTPEVWTMFLAAYAALTFSAAAMFILASSQWVLNEPVWGLWVGLGCLVALGGVHTAGHTGRKLGRPQMRQMQTFLYRSLGDPTIVVDTEAEDHTQGADQSGDDAHPS
jgi:hypothetical protein